MGFIETDTFRSQDKGVVVGDLTSACYRYMEKRKTKTKLNPGYKVIAVKLG